MFSQIGTKINKLRTDQKLTLKDLSQLTNLSVGFLSQLERGLTTVAIDSLDSISKALGVDISFFFSVNKYGEGIVMKSYEKEVNFMDKDNFVQYYLSKNLTNKKLLPRLIEIFPKKDGETVCEYSHEGEEFIYIIEGILTYYYGDDKYELYPGDSVHADSSTMHNWENNTNKVVKLLEISIPNKFEITTPSDIDPEE